MVKVQSKGDPFSIREKCTLLVTVILGEDGRPLFTEADIPALMKRSATEIDRLYDVAARMSGIDVGDGRPSYLQTLVPDKLIRALVDRGDTDAQILAAIDGDELKWWFDRLVSSPAECRALLAELRPQPSSGEDKPEPGDKDRATEQNRRRGRPKGTRSVPRKQIIDRFRSLRANYGRNPTEVELVANLNPRIEVRTLQEHLTDYELPWPIE